MRNLKLMTLVCAIMLTTACASRYKRINPETLVYNSMHADGEVTLEYKYDVLRKKYKKQEGKKKVRVVALKITNKSSVDRVVGQDLKLVYQNGSDIPLLDNQSIYKNLKQHPATYLFYMLLTPVNAYVSSGYNASTSTIPIGLVIGPGITLGNMLTSSGANRKFRRELEAQSVMGKTVKAGQTLHGVIGINSESYDPIQIKVQ